MARSGREQPYIEQHAKMNLHLQWKHPGEPPNHSAVLHRRSTSLDAGSIVQALAVRTIMFLFPSSNLSATVCNLLVLLLLKNVIRMPFFFLTQGTVQQKNYFLNTARLLIVSIENMHWFIQDLGLNLRGTLFPLLLDQNRSLNKSL